MFFPHNCGVCEKSACDPFVSPSFSTLQAQLKQQVSELKVEMQKGPDCTSQVAELKKELGDARVCVKRK